MEQAEAAYFGAGPFLANFGCGGSGVSGFRGGSVVGECVAAALAGSVVVAEAEADWVEEVLLWLLVVGCFLGLVEDFWSRRRRLCRIGEAEAA